MGSVPLVVIVVPVFNGARYILETLESVRTQTVTDWQCVVVDDGSTDNSAEVVRQFIQADDRFALIRQENAGVSVARNAGMRAAAPEAPYVTFMDGDDVWEPQALETLVRGLEAAPDAVGVHGVADYIDENGAALQPGDFATYCRRRIGFDGRQVVDWPPSLPTSFNVLLLRCVFPPGLLLLRRAPVEAVGGFDPAVRRFQDWEFLCRLSLLGDLVFQDELILRYRRHSGNLTNDHRGNQEAYLGMRLRLHFREYQSPAHRKLARSVYRPLQLKRLRDQAVYFAECVRTGRLAQVPYILAHAAGVSLRYIRGYPTQRGWLRG